MEIKEIWKDIEGYENLYQVSNLGRVKSLPKKVINPKGGKCGFTDCKILSPGLTKNGYLRVQLYKNKKPKMHYVHKLVAITFIPNPKNKEYVDHINTIKTDNRVENLCWVTREENQNNELTRKHISESKKGENHPMYNKVGKDNKKSIKVVQLSLDGELVKIWDGMRYIERVTGFYQSNICQCCKNKLKSYKGYIWMYYEDYIKQGALNNENI